MNANATAIRTSHDAAQTRLKSDRLPSACDALTPPASGLLERYRRDPSGLRQDIERRSLKARDADLYAWLAGLFARTR